MIRNAYKISWWITITIAMASSELTFAQDHSDLSAPLNPLFECTELSDNTARLECMDKEVAKLQFATEEKKLVVIDETEARNIKKEAFGFNIPSLPKLSFPKLGLEGEKKESLNAAISSTSGRGRNAVLTLDNGQLWRITDIDKSLPKGALSITIKPAALGSYLATITNGKRRVRGIRVKRIS